MKTLIHYSFKKFAKYRKKGTWPNIWLFDTNSFSKNWNHLNYFEYFLPFFLMKIYETPVFNKNLIETYIFGVCEHGGVLDFLNKFPT